MQNIHIKSPDISSPDKNLSRMSVAILALRYMLALRCPNFAQTGEGGGPYKTPRPRMTMTVALACLVILTPQSMGMGISACQYKVRETSD
jgi:hypothetical protein